MKRAWIKRILLTLLVLFLGFLGWLAHGCYQVLRGQKFDHTDARPLFESYVMSPIPQGVEPYAASGIASIGTTSVLIEFRLTGNASEIFLESKGFHRLTGEKLAEKKAQCRKDFVPDEVYLKGWGEIHDVTIYIQGQKGIVYHAH